MCGAAANLAKSDDSFLGAHDGSLQHQEVIPNMAIMMESSLHVHTCWRISDDNTVMSDDLSGLTIGVILFLVMSNFVEPFSASSLFPIR